MPTHPIFDEIRNDNLAAVQTHMRADPSVLDEMNYIGRTPLMYAICRGKTDIALYLIEHCGTHDLDTTRIDGFTAMHYACWEGQLEVVQALVAAGANATQTTFNGWTPLMLAALQNHADVAFLLSLPSVLASIDSLSGNSYTALSAASSRRCLPVVRLLLDAGADPTIPAGPKAPLAQAINNGRSAIAALLIDAINRETALALLKARTLLDASQPNAPVPACLQGRVARNQPLPTIAINDNDEDEDNEEVAATLRFVLGLEGHGGWAGAEDERATMRAEGLFPEVFVELLEYLLPAAVARAGMQ